MYEDPRLAALYDPLERDRPDLAVYATIVDELGARAVLDVGCGTERSHASSLSAGWMSSASTPPGRALVFIARRRSAKPRRATIGS